MKKGWDKYADQKRIASKGYVRKLRTLNPIPKVINEPSIDIKSTDTTERSGDDERIIPSIVDVPVVPRKQVRRKRKNGDHQRNV